MHCRRARIPQNGDGWHRARPGRESGNRKQKGLTTREWSRPYCLCLETSSRDARGDGFRSAGSRTPARGIHVMQHTEFLGEVPQKKTTHRNPASVAFLPYSSRRHILAVATNNLSASYAIRRAVPSGVSLGMVSKIG